MTDQELHELQERIECLEACLARAEAREKRWKQLRELLPATRRVRYGIALAIVVIATASYAATTLTSTNCPSAA